MSARIKRQPRGRAVGRRRRVDLPSPTREPSLPPTPTPQPEPLPVEQPPPRAKAPVLQQPRAVEIPVPKKSLQEPRTKKDFVVRGERTQEKGIDIQALLFRRTVPEFDTVGEVKQFARKNKFKARRVRIEDDFFRVRQKSPSLFDQSTFKRRQFTKNIFAIEGKLL